MPRTLSIILCALVLGLTARDTNAQDHVLGQWLGAVETPRGPFRLAFSFTAGESGLRGEMRSVDQAPDDKIPLSDIVTTDSSLAFRIQSIGASFEARWDARDSKWRGSFRQGAAMPLTLARSEENPAAPEAVTGMDGRWNGAIDRNGTSLRLIVRIATTAEGTQVRLDSPDLGAADLIVEDFRLRADSVWFRIPAAGVSFAGVVSASARSMVGSWSRPQQPSVQVTFTRTAPASSARDATRRTQWPLAPSSYASENVSFTNPLVPEVTLQGTLTVPEGRGPFPAVVLISGSGPQDRDGTMFGHHPFAVLADHLTRRGIAVLRYDDRGYGASSGNHASATSADFATDAAAAVTLLRSRADIVPKAIGLIGHSEGGMIGPMAAVANDAVAFLILLAGPGTPVSEMLLSQRRLVGLSSGLSPEVLASTEPHMRRVFAAATGASDQADAEARIGAVFTPEVREALGLNDAQVNAFAAQLSGTWFRYFLSYDPAPVLARIQVPVLALGGSLDLQVPSSENLPAIAAALSRNRDVTIEEVPGLNHFFQPARTGAASEYGEIAESFSPLAMERMASWIHDRFRAP